MDSLWGAIGRRRDDVIARGSAFVRESALVRRGREAGVDLLARAEQRASELQGSISSRRSGLDGQPLQRLERRLLLRLEDVLQRVGQGLRHRVQRLSTGAGRIAIEPDAAPQPEDATLVDELETHSGGMPRALEPAVPPVTSSPARTPAARANGNKRDLAVGEAAPSPAPAEEPAPKRTKARAKKAARPAARRMTQTGAKAPKVASAKAGSKSGSVASSKAKASTRWVARPLDVEALGNLPVKALLSQIRAMDEASCRALLAHEKQNKNRKSVIDALAARLAS